MGNFMQTLRQFYRHSPRPASAQAKVFVRSRAEPDQRSRPSNSPLPHDNAISKATLVTIAQSHFPSMCYNTLRSLKTTGIMKVRESVRRITACGCVLMQFIAMVQSFGGFGERGSVVF